MNPLDELRLAMSRRHFFNRCGVSLGTAALASMLSEDAPVPNRQRKAEVRQQAVCRVSRILRRRRSV